MTKKKNHKYHEYSIVGTLEQLWYAIDYLHQYWQIVTLPGEKLKSRFEDPGYIYPLLFRPKKEGHLRLIFFVLFISSCSLQGGRPVYEKLLLQKLGREAYGRIIYNFFSISQHMILWVMCKVFCIVFGGIFVIAWFIIHIFLVFNLLFLSFLNLNLTFCSICVISWSRDMYGFFCQCD